MATGVELVEAEIVDEDHNDVRPSTSAFASVREPEYGRIPTCPVREEDNEFCARVVSLTRGIG